ncbi:MAG: hypothetical protein GXO96_04820 [Nitrospirae bacterium]|nr:hypothetical protein [Candidatus Manganitrophaceae bacterium]
MNNLTSSILKVFPMSKDALQGKKQGKKSDVSVSQEQIKTVCQALCDIVDDFQKKDCKTKAFDAEKLLKGEGCACAGVNENAEAVVDLVVLVDTSGSMAAAAANVSNAAATAIAAAQQSCPTDLRLAWFGLEGTWPGTNFLTTSRNHLLGLGVNAGNLNTVTNEDGAKGVGDLAKHYDWREGACRAILYIGDEGMEQGDPHDGADDAAVTQAIADVNMSNVQIFTHRVSDTGVVADPAKIASYQSLATQTGGKFFNGPAGVGDYETLVTDVICNACGVCKHAPIDDIEPCLSLSWGDSDCDKIETTDSEKICITACNCYDNITFKDLIVKAVIVLDAQGQPVATLPDGTPSADITPLGPICFGDILPCDQEGATCVSRQALLQTCGAIPGDYLIAIFYCYEATFHGLGAQGFKVKLCAS